MNQRRKKLNEEQKRYLQTLPDKADVFGTDYLSVHSHPEHVDEYVMPQDFPRMRPYLDDYEGSSSDTLISSTLRSSTNA